MTDEERYMMLLPSEVTWPVTWVFTVRAGWGLTQQTLTVDVPALEGSNEASRRLGQLLWSTSLALASSADVSLIEYSTTCWRSDTPALPEIPLEAHGAAHTPGTGREDAGQFVLHTGHLDQWARRRIPLPSLPVGWVEGRRLAWQGWNALLTIAEGLAIGTMVPDLGGPFRLLIAYPGLFVPSLGNTHGVAFRYVTKVRVCSYTDRAPEPPGGLDG